MNGITVLGEYYIELNGDPFGNIYINQEHLFVICGPLTCLLIAELRAVPKHNFLNLDDVQGSKSISDTAVKFCGPITPVFASRVYKCEFWHNINKVCYI